ncbi:MAG: DEAD/DEAH box helicase [Bacillota bacterium]
MEKEEKIKMPIRAKPYSHQVRAFEFGLDVFECGKALAYLMEMGTGKTLTTIALAGELSNRNDVSKLLIVAPKSIVSVWEQEFKKFADFEYNLCILSSAVSKKDEVLANMRGDNLQIVVVNYESAWRIENELTGWNPDMIVCDESTKIKNPKAKASKCMHKLGKDSKFNIILTGTPVVNSPIDFFSQYKFLDRSIFGDSFYQFKNKYAILGGYGNHQIIGYNNLAELTGKVHEIACRVKLADAIDLPPFIDETRLIELEPKAKRTYKSIEMDSYAQLASGEVTAQNVLAQLLRLSQITGGFIKGNEDEVEQVSAAKLDALEDVIDVCLGENKKIVVFARFVPEIKAIEKLLKKKGIGYALIFGEVKDRASEIDNFQNNADCKVFVGQIQTVGMGLTLTAGSVAVYYSLDFNYANYEQSRARIHRIGQKDKCLYIHLIAKDTVDEKILQALKQKKSVAELVVDNWRDLLGGGNG